MGPTPSGHANGTGRNLQNSTERSALLLEIAPCSAGPHHPGLRPGVCAFSALAVRATSRWASWHGRHGAAGWWKRVPHCALPVTES